MFHRLSLAAGVLAVVVAISAPLRAASPAPAVASPRPLSEAERLSVAVAADYLARGPEAVWDKLAPRSPFRALGKDAALPEIETRLGPREGASWELRTVVPAIAQTTAVFSIVYPSGADETLVLEVSGKEGALGIDTLRIAGEPTAHALPVPPWAAAAAAPGPRAAKPADNPARDRYILILVALGIAALGGASVAAGRRQLVAAALVAVAAVVAATSVVVAVAALPPAPPPAKKEPATPPGGNMARLAPLLELRRAVATGEESALASAFRKAPSEGPCGEIAVMWKAQKAVQGARFEEARKLLSRFPARHLAPLPHLLRGRLSYLAADEVETAVSYERAIDLGPGHDGLWIEAAESLGILGFEDRATAYFERLERSGSRSADVRYMLASLAVYKNELDLAESRFRTAWQLRPLPREQLFDGGALWAILTRPALNATLALSEVAEPAVAPAGLRRPLQFPAGAVLDVSGESLRIRIEEQELDVPGGATACDVPPRDAGAWLREREQRALAELPRLRAAGPATALSQPLMRRRLDETAAALAKRFRWGELAGLTEGLQGDAEHIPAGLLLRRAEALHRVGRVGEAGELLRGIARNPAVIRRAEPGALVELARQLAEVDRDLAVKVIERAGARRELPFLDDRVRQIRLDQRLAADYAVHDTAHFHILYPRDMAPIGAEHTGRILEAELTRLSRIIPLTEFRRTGVHLLWWEEFRTTFAGGFDIVGLYDGTIRLPFAGVPAYIPEVVAILTHELVHAMIAQATQERAPHWLQEGVAQHLEMTDYRTNPLAEYQAKDLLSLPVIEGVLRSFPEPELVERSYIESFTILRYVEARHGAAAIPKLIAAFRDGATSEEAVARVTGMPLADFERRFREWCAGEAPKIWHGQVRDYGEMLAPPPDSIDRGPRAIPESIRKRQSEYGP